MVWLIKNIISNFLYRIWYNASMVRPWNESPKPNRIKWNRRRLFLIENSILLPQAQLMVRDKVADTIEKPNLSLD